MIPSSIAREAGRRVIPPWLDALHREMGQLADTTSRLGWDRDEDALDGAKPSVTGAKPIGVRLWSEALMLAVAVALEFPDLPHVTPGADPSGHIWLTWESGAGTRLALKLEQGLLVRYSYVWETTLWGVKSHHRSARVRDVFEALRAAFPVVRGT